MLLKLLKLCYELSNIFGLRAYEFLCLLVDYCVLTRNWFVC